MYRSILLVGGVFRECSCRVSDGSSSGTVKRMFVSSRVLTRGNARSIKLKVTGSTSEKGCLETEAWQAPARLCGDI